MDPANVASHAIPELKRQTQADGCDGIIEIDVRKPHNCTLETRTIHVRATGVIYK